MSGSLPPDGGQAFPDGGTAFGEGPMAHGPKSHKRRRKGLGDGGDQLGNAAQGIDAGSQGLATLGSLATSGPPGGAGPPAGSAPV
jgi:hypothetical protein